MDGGGGGGAALAIALSAVSDACAEVFVGIVAGLLEGVESDIVCVLLFVSGGYVEQAKEDIICITQTNSD
jgi:hypothetical protein